MKQTIMAVAMLTLICCQSLSAQKITTSKTKKINSWEDTQITSDRVSYVSFKKDTLILPNDNLGKLIHSSWKDTPKKEQPVILFADEKVIKQKNEKLYASLRKKQVFTKN